MADENQITLTTTKERLHEACKSCSTAKLILSRLFPEYFDTLNKTPAIDVKFETSAYYIGGWILRTKDGIILFDNSIPHQLGNRIKLHGKSGDGNDKYKFRIEGSYLIIEEETRSI